MAGRNRKTYCTALKRQLGVCPCHRQLAPKTGFTEKDAYTVWANDYEPWVDDWALVTFREYAATVRAEIAATYDDPALSKTLRRLATQIIMGALDNFMARRELQMVQFDSERMSLWLKRRLAQRNRNFSQSTTRSGKKRTPTLITTN